MTVHASAMRGAEGFDRLAGLATLPELLEWRIARTPSREAYRQFEGSGWVSYSWVDVGRQVGAWRRALRAESLPSGARIGILVGNGLAHVYMDQAALSLGFVPVPMHVVDNPESLAYVLSDSGASLLFVESAARWKALEPLKERMPSLRRVVYLGAEEPQLEPLARSLAPWLAAAASSAAAVEPVPIDAESLAAIVYTSGTTGRPKGVMLSHRNILSNVQSVMEAIPVLPTDLFLSFLPLSHTLERTAGYYLPIAAGAAVAFSRAVSKLAEDFQAIRPTVLISVPRIYERAYGALLDSLEHRPVSRAVFAWAVSAGWRRFERVHGLATSGGRSSRLFEGVLDRWLAARVRARFGGRLRAAVTGGAPLAPHVSHAFLAFGVPMLEGYGLTEAAPVIACNTLTDNAPGSVGRPLPGVEVRIGDQAELLVRGPNVMLGYWQRPEETARAIGPDGWLHTGDQAQLVAGRIVIRGRLKDIIVTSTGEKIAPVDLETAILGDTVFEQVMVIGEGRPYIAALAVLNRESWAREAQRLGLDPGHSASLRSAAALQWALGRIAAAVRDYPAYARPRAVFLSTEVWTVGEGLVTPTQKPKRPALEARFASAIAELYRGHLS